MVRSTQRTLFMLDLDMHRSFGKQYKPMINTTLNEKFNILTTVNPPNRNTYPTLNCFCIGAGGSVNIEGNTNYAFNEHSPIDGALFKHVPFIVREESKDLTDEEKLKYRMRVVENIGTSSYACYYLKVITNVEIQQLFYSVKTITDGVTVSAPTLSPLSTNMSSILNPVPRNRTVSYKTMDSVEYVTLLNKLTISLTANELEEIKNALIIKGIDNNYITEIGLCTSIDYDYGTTKEAIYTQIAYHLGVSLSIIEEISAGTTFQKSIELGGMEPFLR